MLEEEDNSLLEEEGDSSWEEEGDVEGEGEWEWEWEEEDSSDGSWEGQAEVDSQVDALVDAQGMCKGTLKGDAQGDMQGDVPVDMQVDAQVEEEAEEEVEVQEGGAMKKHHSLRPHVQSDGKMDKLCNYQGLPSAFPIVAPIPMEEDTSDDHGLSLLHSSSQQLLPGSLKCAAKHSPPSPGAQFTHLLSE